MSAIGELGKESIERFNLRQLAQFLPEDCLEFRPRHAFGDALWESSQLIPKVLSAFALLDEIPIGKLFRLQNLFR